MKLLVDTSTWSLVLRRRGSATLNPRERQLAALLEESIRDGRVVMIGPIRQELLSGIREQAQFDRLKTALRAFKDETVETADYEHAPGLYNLCRSHGVECGPVDILICAVAERRKWQVLSNDAVLNRCLNVTSGR